MDIKIKKLSDSAIIPKRQSSGSMGSDLYADIKEDIIIQAGETKKIPTGIAIELPTNELGAFVFGRSGLGINNGIAPANKVGCIDSDYRGEIIVGLRNYSSVDFTIKPGDRIAQLVIMPVVLANFIEVDELGDTARAGGRFGSTGER